MLAVGLLASWRCTRHRRMNVSWEHDAIKSALLSEILIQNLIKDRLLLIVPSRT